MKALLRGSPLLGVEYKRLHYTDMGIILFIREYSHYIIII